MVCAHCGFESHRTGDSSCKGYCTLCAQSGHRQQRGTCPYRVCNTCGETGHSARECNPRCKACGSSDHRNSSSFACPEHKYSKCKARWIQKGTISTTAPEAPYVKHAAAQTIETLRASNVLSTSARNAKERWIQKGTIRVTVPRC